MKKIFVFLLLGIFLINFISAADFDNYLRYEDQNRKVQVKDSYFYIDQILNWGEDIASVEIKSHINLSQPIYVAANQYSSVLVAEIDSKQNYKEFIGEAQHKNMKTDEFEILDQFWQKAIYGDVEVYDYGETCNTLTFGNGTYNQCTSGIIGSHFEKGIVGWENISNYDIEKGEKITIRLMVWVDRYASFDTYPKFFGRTFWDWATWENPVVDVHSGYTINTLYSSPNEDDWCSRINASSGSRNISRWSFHKDSNPVECYVRNLTDTIYSGSPTGSECITDGSAIIADMSDAYLCTGSNLDWTAHKATGATLPESDTNIDWIDSWRYRGGFNSVPAGEMWEVMNVTTLSEASPASINITYPVQAETYSVNYLDLNYTFEDGGNADSCWYSLDLGETNSSRVDCGTNFSQLTASEGSNTWTAYINLTDGTLANDTKTFAVNTTPSILYAAPTPDDYTNQTFNSFAVNVTTTETFFENITFNLYNTSKDNVNSTIFTDSTRFINFTNLPDGDYDYNVTIWTNTSQTNSTPTRNIKIDSTAPAINLTQPRGIVDYSRIGDNLTIIWSIEELNLDSCWYDYNGTNVTTPCGTNTTQFKILDYDNRNLTFYVNDSFGRLSSNFTEWNYTLLENSITYNNNVFESAAETFVANFTKNEDVEISLVSLIYAGSQYIITNISEMGNEVLLTRTIDIPLNNNSFANQTNDFYFNFVYEGGDNKSTSTNNQNVSFINLQYCNGSFENAQALNFTMKDETNQTLINPAVTATSFQAAFYYWLGTGGVYKNYSYSLLEDVNISDYQFCIYPQTEQNYAPYNNSGMIASMISLYSASQYSERQYYINNATLSNVSQDLDLFLLNESSSVKFTLIVKEGTSFVNNAYVTISKFFIGDGFYKTISIRKTDENGEFVEYLELDRDYKYYVVIDGQLRDVIEKRSSCQEAPCELTLQIDESKGDVWEGYYDYYAENINSNLSYDPSSNIVTYEFIDITGLATYFRLQVDRVHYNETQQTICDETSYTSSGTLTCDVSGYNGDFIARTYISRSPEKVDQVIYFLIGEIQESWGLMALFVSFAIILTLTMAGAAISRGNPSVILFMFGLAILATKFMTILPFSWGLVGLLEFIIIVLLSWLNT